MLISDYGCFGAFVRRERKVKGISLRKMARKINVSPTYLSQVELGKFSPPTEDKVLAIASIIECDPDYLLAKAGRIATDISDIIKCHPIEFSALLRNVKHLERDEITKLVLMLTTFL